MNLWRQENFGAGLIAYMHQWRDTNIMYDQDALNACAHQRWKKLPLRWNICPVIDPMHSFARVMIDEQELLSACENPSIVHFAGPKPWQRDGLNVLWANLWYETLDRTPFEVKVKPLPTWLKFLMVVFDKVQNFMRRIYA